MNQTWLDARIFGARVRLAEARAERMVFERQMDVGSADDALMLAALAATESALAHEIGFLLLRLSRREKVFAA